MKKLTLTNHVQSATTVLENEFIDHYMTEANGEYVKVYLLLLRHLSTPSGTLSISKIADLLDVTEKDVIRALNYWKKQGLLEYESLPDADTAEAAAPAPTQAPASEPAFTKESDMTAPSVRAAEPAHTTEPAPAAESARPADTAPTQTAKPTPAPAPAEMPSIQQYKTRKEFKELLFVAEQYLGKTLSRTDVDTITYFYETLHMSADLIEYLIEYCVENGHKSMHYIQKVALSWNERKITTVQDAKAGTMLYNKNCYSILSAFGIKGRAPAPSEVEYIKRWSDEYGFSLDIILNACGRTMNAIHQPSFDYTESILKKWLDHNVHQLKDIEALDAGYLLEKERKKKQTAKPAASTKFNNFESRAYDMSDLERKLVQQ